MAVPIVRSGPEGIGGELMPREISDFIFERAARASAVMQQAPSIPLTGRGKTIPVVTGRPTASWVDEGGRKPVSDATISTKQMDPKKIAVIVPFSKEYLRDNTINIMQMLRPQIAEAFAMAFDAAALYGTASPFTTYVNQTTNAVTLGTATTGGYHADLVGSISQIIGGANQGKGYRHNGWAFDSVAEPELLASYDGQGRPLLVESATNDGNVARLIGRRVSYYDNVGKPAVPDDPGTTGVDESEPEVLGFGGDWQQARYGVASDISYDISSQATIELADNTRLNLWQDNLVALLAEAEYGFIVNDPQAFSRVNAAA